MLLTGIEALFFILEFTLNILSLFLFETAGTYATSFHQSLLNRVVRAARGLRSTKKLILDLDYKLEPL